MDLSKQLQQVHLQEQKISNTIDVLKQLADNNQLNEACEQAQFQQQQNEDNFLAKEVIDQIQEE